MPAMNSTKNRNYYLHTLVYLMLNLGIGYLPAFGPSNANGDENSGDFYWRYLWVDFHELIWPSIFSMIAFAL